MLKEALLTTLVATSPTKVAFIADQGLREESYHVLELIKNEGAHAVVHSGDLDGEDNPTAWNAMISEALGPDFPYFVSAGNHDRAEWKQYQSLLEQRLHSYDCDGIAGVKQRCRFNDLTIVLTAPEVMGFGHRHFLGHDEYIKENLEGVDGWKICSWHENMRAMQTGKKKNAVG